MKISRALNTPFAGIYYMNVAGADTVLAEQDVWYQVTAFDTNHLSRNAVPDHTNDHITIKKSDYYKVFFSISSRSQAANKYHFMVKVNNGTTDAMNIMCHIITDVAGRIESNACEGYVDVSVDDTVELWVKRVDGGAVTKTITTEHVTMNVSKVPG